MNYSSIAFENLRVEMARENLGIGQMAKALHIGRDTLSRKLSKRSPLYLDEAFQIRDCFFSSCGIEYLFGTQTD